MTLHDFLDWNYGADGDEELLRRLEHGADPNETSGMLKETPLHVAVRRYRLSAVEIILDHKGDIDAKTRGGKTAYAHSARRGFNDLARFLQERGADTFLNEADSFAVAIVGGRLDDARKILLENPGVVRTGNPEEDRLLADVSGRNHSAPVDFLIRAGANLAAPGLDDGTPLHQAAWFGQPENARLLIEAGAPLDKFDSVHGGSPIGWAAHGSTCSGGAAERQHLYVSLVKRLLKAGASLHYPEEKGNETYFQRLLDDASPKLQDILRKSAPG